MGHEDNGVIEGTEINELPVAVYNETLKKIVEDKLKSSFDDCNVKIEPGSAKGDNYIGVVYRVTATSPLTGENLKIIVKLPPQNAARRDQFFARPCFVRESEFYDTIYPMFKKFQEEKGIDVEKDGFNEVAGCYASLTDEPFEGLYFEDLKACGFEMYDRLKEVRAEHVNLLMKALGKMHAISFAIKDQIPEWMEPYKELRDIFLMREDEAQRQGMETWFKSLKTQALDTLADCENEELKKKAEEFFVDGFYETLEKGIDKESAEPYAILAHGDCWNNNLMYHYDKNGVPDNIRLLDFQIMRYCSPVCDIMYYIFACTSKELRDEHYQNFMNLYYETLSSFLEKLGSDPKKVFPREAFEDHLLRFGRFGLTMASMVLPIFVSEVDDIPDMDEIAEKMQEAEKTGSEIDPDLIDLSKGKSNEVYKKRMRGVFDDLYRLGYF